MSIRQEDQIVLASKHTGVPARAHKFGGGERERKRLPKSICRKRSCSCLFPFSLSFFFFLFSFINFYWRFICLTGEHIPFQSVAYTTKKQVFIESQMRSVGPGLQLFRANKWINAGQATRQLRLPWTRVWMCIEVEMTMAVCDSFEPETDRFFQQQHINVIPDIWLGCEVCNFLCYLHVFRQNRTENSVCSLPLIMIC